MIHIRPTHIRTRLTLWFVSMLAMVVVLYSATASIFLLRDLRKQLVRHAIQDLETVEGLLYLDADGHVRFREDYHNHPESKRVLERLLEVRSITGEVLLRNDLLGQRTLGDTLLPNEGEDGYSPREFVLSDGQKVQMVSRRHDIDRRPTIIRVAFSEEPLRRQFQSNLASLLLPLPLILLVTGIGGYVLSSKFLQPIQHMARQAEAITSDKLHERLAINASDGELADLSRVFNNLLVRLQQSFEQLNRFTSDASHELRTPLAAIRSVGEVGLRKEVTAAGYRDVIGSMLEEVDKLTRLVDSLLVVARFDSGQVQLERSPVSLSDLAEDCASLFEALLDDKALKLQLSISSQSTVTGDRLLLRQALVNILDNAIKYTPRGGTISIHVWEDESSAYLDVQDHGPGLAQDQQSRVFDRFYRVEEGRSRNLGGVGLGLSIADRNVRLHGGRITVRSEGRDGSVFSIALPLAAPSAMLSSS